MEGLATTLLAMQPPADGAGGNPLVALFPFLLIFGIFYFLLIAPARKREKKRVQMIENLKAGDRVVTNGGIHGQVVGVADGIIQLRIAEQVKIDVSKNAIAGMQGSDE